MSLPDLIFAVFWFCLGVLTLRRRRAWPRLRPLTLGLGVLFLVLALLWLDLAL